MATIVLTDDHILLRNGLAALVKNLGHTVLFEADNGKDFVNKLDKKNLPQLVLMDINMPEMDGYTLTARIRSLPSMGMVPIVALTANVMKGDRERSLEAGCDGYIPKPISATGFLKSIKEYLC